MRSAKEVTKRGLSQELKFLHQSHVRLTMQSMEISMFFSTFSVPSYRLSDWSTTHSYSLRFIVAPE
jgi:hypothetical protein